MSGTAVKPRKRVQDRWWWPPLVVSLFVLSIGMAPPWTVWAFDQLGVGLHWLERTNCDAADTFGDRPDSCP